MSWLEIALIVAALAGVFAGAALVAQRPSFWLGMASAMIKAGLPHVAEYVTKRMPPEEEEAWRKCQLRGGKWNHRKKRCE